MPIVGENSAAGDGAADELSGSTSGVSAVAASLPVSAPLARNTNDYNVSFAKTPIFQTIFDFLSAVN